MCLVLFAASLCFRSATANDGTGVEISFRDQIAPILAANCYECHGPDEEHRQAGLRLDHFEDATAPLESGGFAITPGNAETSKLISVITSADPDVRMPPADGNKRLTPEQITLLKDWINQGAVWQGHWAFERIQRHPTPRPEFDTWPSDDIDRFILHRLESAGLVPAAKADRRTLIRRATFDLIGLPPTVDEVAEFVADDSPNAFEKVVDRLLASPHYGERWGRHWLDVARYADSNGADENHPQPHAFRYRNYVIDAFNRDLPFDQFLSEQLAGDLMKSASDADETYRRAAATGFLALGVKIIAEKDLVKKQADIVDEQLDTVGKSFMGLTLGCARCHDHKFDPIPTSDYYAMAGIFHSTQIQNRAVETSEFQQAKQQHDAKLAALQQSIDAVQQALDTTASALPSIDREAESFDRGKRTD